MHIEVNFIDIENYKIGILKGQSSHISMLSTMLFVMFTIPREICNMNILLHVCIFFQILNSEFSEFFQNSTKKFRFLTHPYINIAKISFF